MRSRATQAYAELHCHSNFSFLDGASHPEELAVEAARLGLEALAITDHDGFYGVVRFAEAARKVGLPTVFGAEIGLTVDRTGRLLDGHDRRVARSERETDQQVLTGLVPDSYAPDPAGTHLLVLADGPDGYARLSRAISEGHLAGEKSAPRFAFADVVDRCAGHSWVLTGCRKGAVPTALAERGIDAAGRELDRLIEAFGRDRVVVELWDHGDPCDSVRNDALYELAQRRRLTCVATNNVHYATPAQRRLATAVAAVRARRSLAEIDPWLPGGAGAHLRSGAEQAERFDRYPGVVEAAAEIGRAAAFDLALVAPNLPPFPCPSHPSESRSMTEMELLRQVVEDGAGRRYGPRPPAHEDLSLRARAWTTIDHELALIEQLDFAGYFLIVWDLVEFCRRSNIYCQGRGSAANSAVCYALGVTAADAVSLGLLFERFLSPERDGPPDIDIDIESDRREEVIQYVYERYGRHHTAQVANVVTYRSRSSIRDMAKALGHEVGKQDAWSKQVDAWGDVAATANEQRSDADAAARQQAADAAREHTALRNAGGRYSGGTATPVGQPTPIPDEVLALAMEIEDAPRHLGIHSGGMVICDRPVIEVCPVEWARMDKRSVLQWDKDDCAATGLVKFVLWEGGEIDLVAPVLADEIDRVVEVALIRPGPIQGGSVH
ncbi:MAG: PHP domain-containing protein, partial [Actinomycetota bacterium]